MDILSQSPQTQALNKAGLVAGTTTTLSTGKSIDYCINGLAYTLATQTNAASPTTDIATGAAFNPVPTNYGSVFAIGVNAAGAIKVSQGAIQALDSSGKFILVPALPEVPDNFCPLGFLGVKVGATGSAWTFGTSNNSGATGVTYTFQDISTYPSRPLIF